MMLDISADDLRRDLITYRTSTVAIFPKFPAPEATLHPWELTKNGPGTQTLAPCDDLRDSVSGREGTKDMALVWTHLHLLDDDVVWLCDISTKLPDPLLYLALQVRQPFRKNRTRSAYVLF